MPGGGKSSGDLHENILWTGPVKASNVMGVIAFTACFLLTEGGPVRAALTGRPIWCNRVTFRANVQSDHAFALYVRSVRMSIEYLLGTR